MLINTKLTPDGRRRRNLVFFLLECVLVRLSWRFQHDNSQENKNRSLFSFFSDEEGAETGAESETCFAQLKIRGTWRRVSWEISGAPRWMSPLSRLLNAPHQDLSTSDVKGDLSCPHQCRLREHVHKSSRKQRVQVRLSFMFYFPFSCEFVLELTMIRPWRRSRCSASI